jgi:hypothetical protein
MKLDICKPVSWPIESVLPTQMELPMEFRMEVEVSICFWNQKSHFKQWNLQFQSKWNNWLPSWTSHSIIVEMYGSIA